MFFSRLLFTIFLFFLPCGPYNDLPLPVSKRDRGGTPSCDLVTPMVSLVILGRQSPVLGTHTPSHDPLSFHEHSLDPPLPSPPSHPRAHRHTAHSSPHSSNNRNRSRQAFVIEEDKAEAGGGGSDGGDTHTAPTGIVVISRHHHQQREQREQ